MKLSAFSRKLASALIAIAIPFAMAAEVGAIPLSPGDRVRVLIPEGEIFSGVFEVNLDGKLQIPYLEPITAQGLEISEVQRKIFIALVEQKYFRPQFLQVNVSILQWSAIQVNVAGATFQPGRILVNVRTAEEKASQQNQSSGDYPPDRYLTAALRGAGGVTPDADIKAIQLIRNGKVKLVDLTGIFTGSTVEDIPLIAGDQIVVPKLSQPQPEFVRPSQITPLGIRVFISNLTKAANPSIKPDGSSFPYGARFSQAIVSGSCSGGVITAAGRRALLVRTDRITGETKTFERPVEELLRNSSKDAENPFLMPEDAIACYDSTTTDARDVLTTITDFLNPINLLFGGSKK